MRWKVLAVAVVSLLSVAFAQTESPPCYPCSVEALFVSPSVDEKIERRLINILDAAMKTVDIALYSFTDDELGDAVIRAHQRGVKVRVFLDTDQPTKSESQCKRLAQAGIEVRTEKRSGLMHHKFLVVDGITTVTGSYNWSRNADDNNFENVVVIVCTEVARSFTAEFEVLWAVYGVVYVPPPPPPPPPPCNPAECLRKLNALTYAQLVSISGIGATTARSIRDNLPLPSLADLVAVPNVGESRCRAILTHLGCEACASAYCKEK